MPRSGAFSRRWDLRFLRLAREVGSWSRDPNTHAGCVIVRPNGTVASLGYNGFARRMNDDPAIYANRDEKLARVIHAELNAIMMAREPLDNCYTLYTHPWQPCDRCAMHLIQAGIFRVVSVEAKPDVIARWKPSIDRAMAAFEEAGVIFKLYKPEEVDALEQ